MPHYYDHPLETLAEQLGRLKPAAAIVDAGIPCVVWAEDALSFVHNIPAALFCLELFVPDDMLNAASVAITNSLPYARMKVPPEWWQEWKCVDPTMALWTTTSVPLEFTATQSAYDELMPREIWIHPHSIYHFDVHDHSLSVALEDRYPEPFNRIRFPTRVAFLDALIATILDPPCGFRHIKIIAQIKVFVLHFIDYTLRNTPLVRENGELEPETQALLNSLREENKKYFLDCVRGGTHTAWSECSKERREILKRLGRLSPSEASRPLPIDKRPWISSKRSYHTARQLEGFVSARSNKLLRPRSSPQPVSAVARALHLAQRTTRRIV